MRCDIHFYLYFRTFFFISSLILNFFLWVNTFSNYLISLLIINVLNVIFINENSLCCNNKKKCWQFNAFPIVNTKKNCNFFFQLFRKLLPTINSKRVKKYPFFFGIDHDLSVLLRMMLAMGAERKKLIFLFNNNRFQSNKRDWTFWRLSCFNTRTVNAREKMVHSDDIEMINFPI